MKNKKILLAVVALVAVAALFLGAYILTRPKIAEGSKTITVTVVHKDGSEKAFTCHTDAEYLDEVLLAEGLVEGENGPWGLYIHEADGERAVWEENGCWWSVYISGQLAVDGVSDIPVYDGGEYSLVYTVG